MQALRSGCGRIWASGGLAGIVVAVHLILERAGTMATKGQRLPVGWRTLPLYGLAVRHVCKGVLSLTKSPARRTKGALIETGTPLACRDGQAMARRLRLDSGLGSVMNFVYLAWPMRVLDTVTH